MHPAFFHENKVLGNEFQSSRQNAINAVPHGLLLTARLNVIEMEKKSSSVSGMICQTEKRPTNVMLYDSSCWNLSTAGTQWTSTGAACWWHYPCGCGRRVAWLEDDFEEVGYWPDFCFLFFSSDVNKAFFWLYQMSAVCSHAAVTGVGQLKTWAGLTPLPTFRPMKGAFRAQWRMNYTKTREGQREEERKGIGDTKKGKRDTLRLFVVDRIKWLKGKTTNIWCAPQPNGLIMLLGLCNTGFQFAIHHFFNEQ